MYVNIMNVAANHNGNSFPCFSVRGRKVILLPDRFKMDKVSQAIGKAKSYMLSRVNLMLVVFLKGGMLELGPPTSGVEVNR